MKALKFPLVFLFIFFLSWELLVIFFELPEFILPSPYGVLRTLYLQRSVIVSELIPTLLETLIGLALGTGFAILINTGMFYFARLQKMFLPLLVISQAIPVFAIAPLCVIWLGYGMASKFVVTAFMVFFPVASGLLEGLRKIPIAWLELAKIMNVKSRWHLLRYIAWRAALPYFAGGMRVGAAFAPMGAVVSEWVGASRGLGFLILQANARVQIDMMFAAVLVLMVLALLFYFAIDGVLKKCGV